MPEIPSIWREFHSEREVIAYLLAYPFTTPDSNWGEVWNLIQLELCQRHAGGV